MGKFFNDLKESLEEVVAYQRGRLKLKSELIKILTPSSTFRAKDIKRIK